MLYLYKSTRTLLFRVLFICPHHTSSAPCSWVGFELGDALSSDTKQMPTSINWTERRRTLNRKSPSLLGQEMVGQVFSNFWSAFHAGLFENPRKRMRAGLETCPPNHLDSIVLSCPVSRICQARPCNSRSRRDSRRKSRQKATALRTGKASRQSEQAKQAGKGRHCERRFG